MEHAKHIIRAVLLVVLFAVAFVLVRHFAIPESFGETGHFRQESVYELAAPEPVHGGAQMCMECHEEQGAQWAKGRHATVACEVCHGPLGSHPEESDAPTISVDRSYKLCGWCHEAVKARPKDFPQVVLRDHVVEFGAEMKPDVCLECHNDPHNPGQ